MDLHDFLSFVAFNKVCQLLSLLTPVLPINYTSSLGRLSLTYFCPSCIHYVLWVSYSSSTPSSLCALVISLVSFGFYICVFFISFFPKHSSHIQITKLKGCVLWCILDVCVCVCLFPCYNKKCIQKLGLLQQTVYSPLC